MDPKRRSEGLLGESSPQRTNGILHRFLRHFRKAPRYLFIANAAPFASVADVDRLADSIEAAAQAA